MLILQTPTTLQEIRQEHNHFFDSMVKIVVDLDRELVALDAEMHADLEQQLLEEGSEQMNLWGANVYFEGPVFLEFTSLINIRPGQGNRSMEVQSSELRTQIEALVRRFILT
jgi:hypothetical protein